MRRYGLLVLMAGIMLLLLSACQFSWFDTSGENLMKLPQLTDDEQNVLNAVAAWTDSDYSLVYALRGEMQNPVQYRDLNGDGVDEILVFYRSAHAHPTSANSVCLLILARTGDTFDQIVDITGNGIDLDRFDYHDFDGNGSLDLVVGYVTSENQKTLSVYLLDISARTCTEKYVRGYTDWTLTDITNNGIADLVFIHYDTFSAYAYARLVQYQPDTDSFSERGGNNNLIYSSDVYAMTVGPTSPTMLAILITAKRNTLLNSTEILLWDDVTNQLLNMALSDSYLYGDTVVEGLKDAYCSLGGYLPFDIDGDGFVEIPICSELNESKVSMESFLGQETLKYPYTWYAYNYDFIADFSAYMNEDQYYYLKIPADWDFSRIRVYANYKNDLYFYYVPDETDGLSLPVGQRIALFRIQQTSGAKVQGGYQLAYVQENNLCYSMVTMLRDTDPHYEQLHTLMPSGDALKRQFVVAEIPVA